MTTNTNAALREKLIDLIAEHLSGTYHCTRVWEAWNVGTMSQDDFEDVGESDTPAELADAILAEISTAAQPPAGIWVPTELAERVQETLGEFLMDHGWRQQDMDTSDEFGALLAAAPKAEPAQPERVPLTEAARDVLTERQRQISVEGWTSEHDDKEHLPGELALAAASYVCADEQDAPPAIWPWDWSWWKPRDRRRNLVKSGALILAEIELLDRAAARAAKEGAKHD